MTTRPGWITASYPGASVRMQLLQRGGKEVGDIRVQQYGEKWCVATFLPGRDVFLPGDTPKVEPEDSFWTDNPEWADERFDLWVAQARADGWSNFELETADG